MSHILLISLFYVGVSASGPRSLNFNTTVGPDGPWNALIQTVSWPEQNITLLPSLTKTNLFVHSDACSDPSSACPQSQSTLWTGLQGSWSWMNSTAFDASTWDTSLYPLNLSGQASYIGDRITLEGPGDGIPYLDFVANAIDQGINVNFPSQNAWYTMNTGFFSLNGAEQHVEYASVNGSDAISSPLYGLRIGAASSAVSIPGSLVLGGYDKSRCLTTPIVSDTDTFDLTDIGMGVASGESPFPKDQKLSVRSLLQSTGASSVKAYLNPGVPYLYLPHETCEAITGHLPVEFNETLGLCIWNISASSYQDIMSSPSYLSFDFQSGASTSTIYLPFALLNLTLEWPLVDVPTQYFPCSPYQSPDGRFHLGRAFLQGAFTAQNWQTGKLILAQAPGPDLADVSLATISANDTPVSPMIKAPSWDFTWASKLKAFQRNNSSASGNSNAADSARGLSSGARAGIVAVLLLIAGVCWVFFRRRKTRSNQTDGEKKFSRHVELYDIGSFTSPLPSEVWAPGKHGLTMDPVEMNAANINELYGSPVGGKKRNEART